MTTLSLFNRGNVQIPGATTWYLADLGEFRGKQELYTHQAPQRLKTLLEHALIESAVSSNRLEGVDVDPGRVRNLLASPKPLFRDRDEEEVRGYRDALRMIHEQGADLALTEETILLLHRLTRGQIWDAGCYKTRDSDIIERYPDGRERIRFRTVPASETPQAMTSLLHEWGRCIDERWVHPLIAMAAFNLDFLCIHPFRDGNGRVSRLLLLLQCRRQGFEVGRYISLERLIEQEKERYYQTLEQSSQNWHESAHDPWPYVNFTLSMLKMAYQEFVERVGHIQAPRGAKTEMVLSALARLPREFTVAQLEQATPGVSREMLRHILREQKGKSIECIGRGPGAKWIKKG
jgi:Fic family protein